MPAKVEPVKYHPANGSKNPSSSAAATEEDNTPTSVANVETSALTADIELLNNMNIYVNKISNKNKGN